MTPKTSLHEQAVNGRRTPGAVTQLLLAIAALAVLAAVVYAPIRHFGFVSYDDSYYISDNPHVRSGFTRDNIRYAFTAYIGGNWNPLLWFSFYADRALLGLRPGLMHVENVALHWLGGVCVLFLLFDATRGALWRSAIVAGVFVCHPMHVESVAWLTERKDVLSTPLLLLSMIAYVRYTQAPGGRAMAWYGLMLGSFALSLMVKSMGVTLPGVLLLLDCWPLGRVRPTARAWSKLLIEKLPPILLVLAATAVVVVAQRDVGATNEVLGLGDRVANALVAYVIYISKLIVPVNLAVFYPHPGLRPASQVMAAALLLALITAAALALRRRRPYLFVGWFWFLGTLVPVIGLMQIGAQALADRYSYLPSIGLFIMLVWLASDFLDLLIKSPQAKRGTSAVLALGVVAVLSWQCRRQVWYWQDSVTLFTHTAEATGDNWVADDHLGDSAFKRGDLAAAVSYFQDEIRLRPQNARAYFNLGNCALKASPQEALELYDTAIKLDPRKPEYHLNRAAALEMLGRREDALAECREALRVEPGYAPAQTAIDSMMHTPPATKP
jgi:hypothetical protein